MRILLNNRLSILFLFSFFTLVSCSKDSDEPTPQEIAITVTTENFTKIMDENPLNGQIIGAVLGSTNEGSVTFSITEQSPLGAFSIDAASGELKVADAMLFDFETNPTITGTVKVANGVASQIALVTITLNDLMEDNIYEGDVILRTQEEVNNFGAYNYTRINGSLVIGKLENEGYSNIESLSPLLSLKHIDEHFYMQYNGVLTTTSGLDNIVYIGNYFAILLNPSLVNIAGLNNLENIAGDLLLEDNPLISNFEEFSQLSIIGGNLYLNRNELIPNLDWLINLTSIGGFLTVQQSPLIRNVDGLSNLTHLGNSLVFSKIDSLNDLSGLQNLSGPITGLSIKDNNSLISLNGLENIRITGGLTISNNNMLEDLTPLINTTNLSNHVEISNNSALTNLIGLNNLNSIGTKMTINYNENLINLNGLSNLLNVGQILTIHDNNNLTDFCDLQNLFNNGSSSDFVAYSNAYNPTKQDIIDGNCSL